MIYLLFTLLGGAISYLYNAYVVSNLTFNEVSRYASLFTLISVVSFATSTLYFAAIANTSTKTSSRADAHRYKPKFSAGIRISFLLSYIVLLILAYEYSYNLALSLFLIALLFECARNSLFLGRYSAYNGVTKTNILTVGVVTIRFVITFILSALLIPNYLLLSVLIAHILSLSLANSILQSSVMVNQGLTFMNIARSVLDRVSLIYIFIFASYSLDLIILRLISSGDAIEEYALSAIFMRMITIPLLTLITIHKYNETNSRQRIGIIYAPIFAILIGLAMTSIKDPLWHSLSNQILGLQITQSAVYFLAFSTLRSISFPPRYTLYTSIFSFVFFAFYSFFYVDSVTLLAVISSVIGLILVFCFLLTRKLKC